jgi:trk system potassium uptake protein TrkA
MKVTVVGGGRVGYYLAKTLLEHDYEPTIIEIDKKVCSFIANELDIPIICGDATSLEILKEARVDQTEAIIAVSGQDEDNLVACQLAKKIFNVPKTVAKVNNPKNADIMKKLGIDNVISATNRIVDMLEREVDTSKIKEIISLNHGASSIDEIDLPDDYKYDGVSLVELKLPENINVISIERNDTLIIPRGSTKLMSNDKLLVLSNNIPINKIQSIFKVK